MSPCTQAPVEAASSLDVSDAAAWSNDGLLLVGPPGHCNPKP